MPHVKNVAAGELVKSVVSNLQKDEDVVVTSTNLGSNSCYT